MAPPAQWRLGAEHRASVGHEALATASKCLLGPARGNMSARCPAIQTPWGAQYGNTSARVPWSRSKTGNLTAREAIRDARDGGYHKVDRSRMHVPVSVQEEREIQKTCKLISEKASQKFNTAREALRHVDADCDGKVAQSDLRYFFRAYDFPNAVADQFFEYLGPDQDGFLDYYQLVEFFTPLFSNVGAGASQHESDLTLVHGVPEALDLDELPPVEAPAAPVIRADVHNEFKGILGIIGTKAAEKFRTLREVFRFVDTNHDSTISRNEMRGFFRAFNLPAEAANRFHDALEDKSTGEVDFNEFITYLGPYVQSSYGKTDLPTRRAGPPKDHAKAKEEVAPIEEEPVSPSKSARTPRARIDPAMQVELQKLMQDIGYKLDLRFKHIRDPFKTLDLDRTGKITRSEMRAFFRLFGYNDDVSDRIFELCIHGKAYGRNEDLEVDYETFMGHFDSVVGPQFRCTKRAPLIPLCDRHLEKEVNDIAHMMQDRLTTKYKSVGDAFRAVDLNKDGTVSEMEMQKFVRSFGKDPAAAGKIFKALDVDDSGSVQYDEFVALFGMGEKKLEPSAPVHLPRLQGCVVDQRRRRSSGPLLT